MNSKPEGLVPPLLVVTRLKITRCLWGTSFDGKKTEFAKHREEINKKICEMEELPLKLKCYLQQGITLLEQAYIELFQWKNIYFEFQISKILKRSDDYLACRYITHEGHFNDDAFVMSFIQDTEELIQARFEFACYYSFENEISMLWQEMKNNEKLSHDLSEVRRYKRRLTDLWIRKLENKQEEILWIPEYGRHSFCYSGLIVAIEYGYEQAVYYFWKKLSDGELDELIETNDLFFSLNVAAREGFYKIVCFVYQELSSDKKTDLLIWIPQDEEEPHILSCLLESPFTHSLILQDIISLSFPVRSKLYENILVHLSWCVYQLKLPIFRNAFITLWQKTSKEDRVYILEERSLILKNLVRAKELKMAALILIVIPVEERDKCLLEDWIGGGTSSMNILCAEEEYDLLIQYLTFFIVHFNENSRKMSVRNDASAFLEDFFASLVFNLWIEGVSEEVKLEVTLFFYYFHSTSNLDAFNQYLNEMDLTTLKTSAPTTIHADESGSKVKKYFETKKNINISHEIRKDNFFPVDLVMRLLSTFS